MKYYLYCNLSPRILIYSPNPFATSVSAHFPKYSVLLEQPGFSRYSDAAMYCLLPLADVEPISGMLVHMYIYCMKTERELQQGVEQSRDTVNQSDEGAKYAVSSIS